MSVTVCIALGVVLIDQVTKAWVLRSIDASERVHVFGPISLIRRFNRGAAFSLGSGTGLTAWVATVMVVIVGGSIVRHLLRPPDTSPVRNDVRWWIVLGLIIGGGVGNQLDRLFRSGGWNHGAVVDFVDVGFWPVFNVADTALTIGCIGVALLSLAGTTRPKRNPTASLKELL